MSGSLGVIAAGHDLTAQAGEEILRAGGNAYDAALGALAASCVVEPVLASMAGGGFLLAKPSEGKGIIYDFFVQTPQKKKPEKDVDLYGIMADFGSTQQEYHIGMGSAAVPGQIRGMFEIHKDLCSMPMKEIFAPAIAYAKDGAEVNEFQAFLFKVVEAIFLTGKDLKATFGSLREDSKLILEGEILKQPAAADFLELLAVEGADLFYKGEIAQAIDRDMRDGGLVTTEDLAGYEVIRRTPLKLNYRDTVIEMNSPPSSGGVLIALGLKLLEDFDVGAGASGSEEYLMQLARVLDLTLEARLELEQSTHEQRGKMVLDDIFLRQYRENVMGAPKAAQGTTHISVIDKDKNMASMTVSNGQGCHYMIPGTGIVMNNMMGEADLNPGGFHSWEPDSRMTSMMAPSVVNWPDGKRVALGSGGSNRIRTTVLQAIINLVDFKMGSQDAVNASRIHMEEDCLYIEGGFACSLSRLQKTYPGHQMFDDLNLFFGGVHMARSDKSGFGGAGDPRRAGVCKVL